VTRGVLAPSDVTRTSSGGATVGARVLAATEREPHAALRFAERAWGVQFHPEFDADVMRGYIEAREAALRAEGIEPATVPAKDAPEAERVLRTFAQLALR